MAVTSTAPEVLAIIGVRSGSRGLPGKNVRPLAGHPLLAWIVAAALGSGRVTRVVVTTDTDELARVARDYGAETPFLRPVDLAADDSSDLEYVRHALEWLEQHEGYVPDVVVRLLATVPTQLPGDIDAAVDLLLADEAVSSTVVVAEARQHPAKTMRLVDVDGWRVPVPYLPDGPGAEPTARQSYPPAFVRANLIATRPSVVHATGTLTGTAPVAHVIDRDRIVDIDTELDLELAAIVLAQHRPPIPEPVRISEAHA
jgi:CMP-N,N'-diacetyllegionaminic acid synthase